MDHQRRLQEVIDHGSPEQAAYARELLSRPVEDQIDLLYDAYLHDPYLTRN